MPTNEPKTPAAKPAKAATKEAVVKTPAAQKAEKPAAAAKAAKPVTVAKAAKPGPVNMLKMAERKPASGPTVTITQVHSGLGRLKGPARHAAGPRPRRDAPYPHAGRIRLPCAA